ncbi:MULTISPECIES: non-ribosomal peptide synthetase [Planktothrix]|uniref:ApnA n=5 Tax=Planktothrix TaxID=54304 RepID=A0A1U9WVP1_PLARU|nr:MULTISPECIES: non-ribosomal peptide synthetase [Planktothrix]AQY60327.1 ApnA [Planktothrix rubescens NIVA-CYA 18]CAC5344906.1 non ribosomal peptide synthetase, involved in anabaenopeptin biosynthesis [Planktothrix rubescens NIVA-CYA 18]CAD5967257.1 Linear gramicidin synthase subunit C [Planktothrix rubescens NIVA-CYA 18]CAQ48252.1 AnaA protein [Planktothrix prolifica NIVA-CYA 98]
MFKQSIHQLFETQVERTPEAVAVLSEQGQLTYEELNTKANQLAHYLRTLGVKSETLVGVCVDRSLEMVIGLLAILKAGGAYVPLDPTYPRERLTYMVQDAQISVLVTQTQWSNLISDYQGQVICLDSQWAKIASYSQENLVNTVNPENLAYVIYTSGSTGKPKGVMIEHQSLVNFTKLAIAQYQITTSDRTLQFVSISFDVAAEEIYVTLCSGATLILRTEEMISSIPSFVQKSQDWQITVWSLPTAYWHLLVNELVKSKIALPDSLRLVIIGGERVQPELVRMWFKNVGNFPELINVYGPTEGTIAVSLCRLSQLTESQRNRTEIPIGKSLGENISVYVLDETLKTVPPETPGEIYIGGTALARGYLNRPELTAQKFIQDPFSPSERLYKTGDLGRYLADGNLEYLGRVDHQVKINGFRVELGEIETVLLQHHQVAQAVVIDREDPLGNKRLVAYLVPHSTEENLTVTLQQFLKNKLPSYMIPATFVVLNELPLSPNGKIDRKALPIPDYDGNERQTPFIAPRNHQEEKLANIWHQVFGLEKIGVNDNFFHLGGHSLIATQILSRIRDIFEIEVSFKKLLENPTIGDLSQTITEQQQDKKTTSFKTIKPIARDGYLPVSFAQERVYFIEQLAPSITAYQFQESLRIKGFLDVSILEKSISEILRRHEIFRTTFPSVAGKLVQVIHPPEPVTIPIIDLQNISKDKQQEEVQKLTEQAIHKPFDISQLPLIHWTLLKLNEQEWVLIHVEHHMVHDGWSFNLFLKELVTLYQAFSQGKPSPLSEPSLQFVDFAHWQREWTKTEEATTQLNYWHQKLAGIPPLLELPYDRPRPTEQTYGGGRVRVDLPLDICQLLRSLGRQEGVTLFMSMFAVFVAQIYRYTGQEDICVGSGVANRRLRETEGLIGMIVNNIVLRTDVSGNPTFKQLLEQVRQVTLEGYANEDLPFDKVVEVLKPVRHLSYNPLFQVMFSFHDAQLPDLNLPGLTIKPNDALTNNSAKFDLDIVVIPRSEQRVGRNSTAETKGIETEGITMVWEYNTGLFEESTINRMVEDYQTLLQGILANPNQKLSQYSLLTEQQKHQLLVEWNNTQAEYPKVKGIHQLFEEQVKKTPEAIAVIFEDKYLSYQQLNEQANQLAHYLQTLGVKPDNLVGIFLERSLEMFIGLLGILKAGGAYLPLDPTYPEDRLAYMVNDAQISTIVTLEKWANLATQQELNWVCLDSQKDIIAQQSSSNIDAVIEAKNLAYVIYTSGSTGQPKGVLIEHQSLINFTKSAIEKYEITERDTVLQFASINFDAAAEEIYPCLSRGGTLVLRTEEMMKSVSAFIQESQKKEVTIWDLPTAYWHLLVSEIIQENLQLPPSLRLVILGGERVLPERVKMWQEYVGQYPQLVNSYGPTESTVVSTLHYLEEIPINQAEIPIGKPINNVQVYILDQYLQPMPIGVPGELHIGGLGIARGYLNRPELTVEKFIDNPFKTGEKLYKTGDLVRYKFNGNLEFLGRIDSQVKIRGFRIELTEIETVLNQYSSIKQSVVIAREDSPGIKRLVAYIVGNKNQNKIEEIRYYLKQKLPPYMVPSAFVFLEEIPITTNGKVDHRALPIPETTSSLESEFTAPKTPIEERLTAIWAEVLRLEKVSIHDNFFELGGDSIISIQMISKANQMGLQLSPKQLFQYQTIAELATVVGTDKQIKANQELVTGIIPLTPIQHWLFKQDLPDVNYFNQSALIEVPATVNPERLKQVIQALLNHHDALRLHYIQEDESLTQISDTTKNAIPLEVIDLSQLSPSAQKTAIIAKDEETQRSLNLTTGDIVKVVLFNLGNEQPSQLLIVIHHLAIDGISWRILLEDLATAYQQISQSQEIKLPLKTTSFQDWSNQLVTYSQSEKLKQERDYWISQLTKEIASLPMDYSGTKESNQLSSAKAINLFLNEEETRGLLQDVPGVYNTQINDILLTALLESFSQWTGEKSLIVDLEGHGREDLFEVIDLSRTVGWFTTLFPVRLEGSKTGQLPETLKSVKEQLRRLPNRGIGHGILKYLSKDQEVKKQFQDLIKAQVSFNYLGQFDQVLSASGVLGEVKEWKTERSLVGNRSHLLEISGLIRSQKLEMQFVYSEKVHQRETIERLANGFMSVLKSLIIHCQSSKDKGYTPSDFSAAQVSQEQLDKFLSKINQKKGKTR